MGELLANDQYREKLRTALHTMDNRTPQSPSNNPFRNLNTIGSVKTTTLTMTVRINNVIEDVILDSDVAMSVIIRKKVLRLGLEINPINTLNLTAYRSLLEVVET